MTPNPVLTNSTPIQTMLVQSEKFESAKRMKCFTSEASTTPKNLIFLKNIYDFIDQHFKRKEKTQLLNFLNKITESFNWEINPLTQGKFPKLNMAPKSEQMLNVYKQNFILKNDFLTENSSIQEDNPLYKKKKEYSIDFLLSVFMLKVFRFFLLKSTDLQDKPVLKYIRVKKKSGENKNFTKNHLIRDLLTVAMKLVNNRPRGETWVKKQIKYVSKIFDLVEQKEIRQVLSNDMKVCELFFRTSVIFYFREKKYDRSFHFINQGFKTINKNLSHGQEHLSKYFARKENIKDFFEKVAGTIRPLQDFQIKQQQTNIKILEAKEKQNLLKFQETSMHNMFYNTLLGQTKSVHFKGEESQENWEDCGKGWKEEKEEKEGKHEGQKKLHKQRTHPKKMSMSVRKEDRGEKMFNFDMANSSKLKQSIYKTKKNLTPLSGSLIKNVSNLYRSEDASSSDEEYNINIIKNDSSLKLNRSSIERNIMKQKNKKLLDDLERSKVSSAMENSDGIYSNHMIHMFNGSHMQMLSSGLQSGVKDNHTLKSFSNKDTLNEKESAMQSKERNDKLYEDEDEERGQEQEQEEPRFSEKEIIESNLKKKMEFKFKMTSIDKIQEMDLGYSDNLKESLSRNQKKEESQLQMSKKAKSQQIQELMNQSIPLNNKNNMSNFIPMQSLFSSKVQYNNEQLNSILDTPHFDINHPNLHLPVHPHLPTNPFLHHKNDPEVLQTIEMPFPLSKISPIESSTNLEYSLMNKGKNCNTSRFTFKKKFLLTNENSLVSGILSQEKNNNKGEGEYFFKTKVSPTKTIKSYEVLDSVSENQRRSSDLELNLNKKNFLEPNVFMPKKIDSSKIISGSNMSIDNRIHNSKENQQNPSTSQYKKSTILEIRKSQETANKEDLLVSDIQAISSYIYYESSRKSDSVVKSVMSKTLANDSKISYENSLKPSALPKMKDLRQPETQRKSLVVSQFPRASYNSKRTPLPKFRSTYDCTVKNFTEYRRNPRKKEHKTHMVSHSTGFFGNYDPFATISAKNNFSYNRLQMRKQKSKSPILMSGIFSSNVMYTRSGPVDTKAKATPSLLKHKASKKMKFKQQSQNIFRNQKIKIPNINSKSRKNHYVGSNKRSKDPRFSDKNSNSQLRKITSVDMETSLVISNLKTNLTLKNSKVNYSKGLNKNRSIKPYKTKKMSKPTQKSELIKRKKNLNKTMFKMKNNLKKYLKAKPSPFSMNSKYKYNSRKSIISNSKFKIKKIKTPGYKKQNNTIKISDIPTHFPMSSGKMIKNLQEEIKKNTIVEFMPNKFNNNKMTTEEFEKLSKNFPVNQFGSGHKNFFDKSKESPSQNSSQFEKLESFHFSKKKKQTKRGSGLSGNTRYSNIEIASFDMSQMSNICKKETPIKEDKRDSLNLQPEICQSKLRKFMETDSMQDKMMSKSQSRLKKKKKMFFKANTEVYSGMMKVNPESMRSEAFSNLKSSNISSRQKKNLKLILNSSKLQNTIRIQVINKKQKKNQSKEPKKYICIKNNEKLDCHEEIKTIFSLFPWFKKRWLMSPEETITRINYETLESLFIKFFPFLECSDTKNVVDLNLKMNLIPLGDKWFIKILGIHRGLIRMVFINRSEIANCDLEVKLTRNKVSQVYIGTTHSKETRFNISDAEKEETTRRRRVGDEGLFGLVRALVMDKTDELHQKNGFYWENEKKSFYSGSRRNKFNTNTNILDELKEEKEESDESGEGSHKSRKKEILKSFWVDMEVQKEIFDHLFMTTNIKMKSMNKGEPFLNEETRSYFKWKLGISKCYFKPDSKKVYSGKELKHKMTKWKKEFEKSQEEGKLTNVYKSSTNITKLNLNMNFKNLTRSNTEGFGNMKERTLKTFEFDTPRKSQQKKKLSVIGEKIGNNLFMNKSYRPTIKSFQEGLPRKMNKLDDPMVNNTSIVEETFNLFLGRKKQIMVFDIMTMIENVIMVLGRYEEKVFGEEQDGDSDVLRDLREIEYMKINFQSNMEEMSLFIKSRARLFMWINGEVKDLEKVETFKKLSRILNGSALGKARRIKDFLLSRLMGRITVDNHGMVRKIKWPKMIQGNGQIVYFNAEQMHEGIHLWMAKLDKNQKEKKSINKANSIIAYMNELPNDSFLFSNSRMHTGEMDDTYIGGNPKNGSTDQISQEAIEKNKMFTINEIQFLSPGKAAKMDEQEESNSYLSSRFKFFLITFWNFETYQEDEPLIMFSDLENFYSCQCKRNERYKIPSDFSLEVGSSRKITKFKIREKPEHPLLFNPKITPVKKNCNPHDYKAESLRNIIKLSTIESKHKFGSKDMSSLASIEENLKSFNRKPIVNPGEHMKLFSRGLTIDSGKVKLQGSNFSKKLYMSSRKIFRDDRNLSLLKTRSNLKCDCSLKATEEQFKALWNQAVKRTEMGTLIGLLIKAKVLVFRLDARILQG